MGNRCSRTGPPAETLPTPDTTSEISEAMNLANWAASLDPLVNEPLISFSSSMYLPAIAGSELKLGPAFGGDDTLRHGGKQFRPRSKLGLVSRRSIPLMNQRSLSSHLREMSVSVR